MDIKVLGSGCEKCDGLYANTCEALALLGIDERVDKVEDLLEIVLFGVMNVPALTVDGKILLSGRVASAKEIAKLIGKSRP